MTLIVTFWLINFILHLHHCATVQHLPSVCFSHWGSHHLLSQKASPGNLQAEVTASRKTHKKHGAVQKKKMTVRITRAKLGQAGSSGDREDKQASVMRPQQWWAEELAVAISTQLVQLIWSELPQIQCCCSPWGC